MPSVPSRRSLREEAAAADAERFVGRSRELAIADDLLSEDTPSRILHVRGPGGIGKSALLRAIGRRAGAAGLAVVALDTREPAEAFDAGIDRASGDGDGRPVLLVIDEVDLLGSRLADLRDRLLDALHGSARIVLAGRLELDSSWRDDGLDAIVASLAVAPLGDGEAEELLARRGVSPADRTAVVRWAQGSPLALTVASSGPSPTAGAAGAEALESRLTSWLAGDEQLPIPPELVEVAALAPAVDARLLAAALPARATRDGLRQLASLPVVEQVGDRVVLHAVLAAAVRARLDATAPDRKRVISRRIAGHLADRARLGDMTALIELSQFIGDPRLRQAVSGQPSPTLFPNRPRPGDLAAFARTNGFDAGADWSEVEAAFADDLRYSLCIRRADGSIAMVAGFTRIEDLVERGPITASLRLAAAATEVDPVRSFAGIVLFGAGTDHERMEASRLGAGAMMQLHGVADMQAVLIHYPEPDRRPMEAIEAIAAELPGDFARAVALTDFRPAGAVGFVEAVVLGELGAPRSRPDAATLLVEDDDQERQAQLRTALDQVFDDSDADQRLRRAIELVHLGPRRSEQERLDTLHVSRSTWFRLLRRARERVLQSDPPPA